MKINVIANFDKRERHDALVVPFFKGKKAPVQASSQAILRSLIAPMIQSGDFDASLSSLSCVYAQTPHERRIACLGLGDSADVTCEKLRQAYAALVKKMAASKIESLTILLPQIDILSVDAVAQAVSEGIFLANYRFLKLKNETLQDKGNSVITQCLFVAEEVAIAKKAIEKSAIIASCVHQARDLVNDSADSITPQHLGQVAQEIAKKSARMSCKVFGQKWIEKQKMGLFLAVARGACHEPQFITMSYEGNPGSSDHTVLVGKAVTFDTGGLNMKPTGGIETQRGDMAGAAAVLGAMRAISQQNLPINVSAVIASCENAVGPHAYKPGDVYTSFLGKTVEVNNTDAEGRLTLADALAYAAKKLKPSRIIDLATLTGSCVVALGHEVAALLSNSDVLAQELMQSSTRTHERIWELPLYDDYRERLKSDIADIKNTAGRDGGAILGGAFLRDFVEDIPWAHLDIAGTAFLNESKGYLPKYGTGFGVRLLVDFLEHLCNKER